MSEAFIARSHVESPTWPYTERAVETIEYDVAVLLDQPENPLNDVEKAEVISFAKGLFEGEVGGNTCEAGQNLKELGSTIASSHRSEYALGYFFTAQSAEDRSLLGFDQVQDRDELAEGLAAASLPPSVDTKLRRQIAARSIKWRKESLAAAMAGEYAGDDTEILEEPIGVNYKPEVLLDKFEGVQAFRRFYRDVYSELKQADDSKLAQAKKDVLFVHVGKVNSVAAILYPQMVQLAEQLELAPETAQSQALKRRLYDAAPVLRTNDGLADARSAIPTRLKERLDLVRNGAGVAVGRIAVVSEVTSWHAARLQNAPESAYDVAQKFSAAELQLMDGMRWDGDDLVRFNSLVLGEWGLLSDHAATWDEVKSRRGPAPDGKWQVVVTPEADSLEVDGRKKVMLVPESFDRTITQVMPAGALAASAHELLHVQQSESKEELAEHIPLAIVGGRRKTIVRETGGILEERDVHTALGQHRPVNLGYFRALEVKLAGGTVIDAAQAYYDAMATAERREEDEKSLRSLAADRTLRLYRHGGYNSQPLDYLEQDLLAGALGHLGQKERHKVLLSLGDFSTHDSAVLHSYGLLTSRHLDLPDPAETVLRVFRQHYLSRNNQL